ncbi:MAG: BamA/TamA family outer membrane protein [Acidobacteria bacterium]|nr:BamA/TamA family outer membrane protein [Acidobacteriota bacterium]
MRVLLIAAVALLGTPRPVVASPDAFIGQPIAAVRVETADGPVLEPGVLELIETRVGQPLAMARVRDTIDHLVGLGRYDDVRLFAEAAPAGAGVSLRWVLRPIRKITRVSIGGGGGLASVASSTVVSERFGERPAASRVPEIVAAVTDFYRDHGYRAATVVPQLTPGRTAGEVWLDLSVARGPRTTVLTASVTGSPREAPNRILDFLRIEPGQPFDRLDLEERIAAYASRLRADGFYEASVREATTFDDEGHTASVAVDVSTGPRVRLAYAGDPLPRGVLESLVPVREERSVDEDLLEDASRNIEAYLRERGFREARATYTRAEASGDLVLTFAVERGPLHRVGAVGLEGNASVPDAEIEPLLKLTRGDPFVDARVAAIAAAIEELYRVRGHERVTVKPSVEVLPEQAEGSVRFRPVATHFTIVEGVGTTVAGVTLGATPGVPEPDLRARLGLVTGRPFYRPQLAADRDAIERHLRNLGFLSARVTPTLAFSDGNQRVAVTWNISAGEQSVVDHVLITGNTRTSSDVIRRELRLRPGVPLGAEALAESQQRLSQLGLFRRVRIVELPRPGTPQRDVLVTVEEAPATAVTYGGGLEVGRRLRQGAGGVAAERVEVAPRAFFEVSRRNLWGKNRTLSLFSRVSLRPRDPAIDSRDPTDTGGYGLNDYRVTGTFREPRAFGTPGDAQVTAFLERGIRASFTFDRRGVRTDYARRFGTGFTVTGRYTNDYTELFDEQIAAEDRLLIDRLFPQVRLSTFFGAFLRDSRDDVLDPQRGAVIGLDGAVAARAYGSEVGFAKTFLQGFLYRRLPGKGFVLAGGVRAGFATGFAREVPRVDEDGNPVPGEDGRPIVDIVEDLPASERFFAGGDTTVRGFALDRLGTVDTLDSQGFPQGGNGLVVLNAELRAPYWKGVGLVGFVDAGNVFKQVGDIDLGDLRVAAGFGARYRSPIGPLRVDLGFKVNPRTLATGSRERGMIVHISLGQAF